MKQVNLSTKRERKLRRVPDPRATATPATPAPKTVAIAPKTAAVAPKTTAAVAPKTTLVMPKPVVPKTARTAPAAVVPAAASAPAASRPPAPCKAPPSTVATLPQGRVSRFLKEKGYGFIALNGQEVFFHVDVLVGDSIKANDIVEVVVAKGGTRPRATKVRVLRSGSIYRQICRNKCCQARGERHFEDRCPRGGFKDDDDDDVST